MAATGHSCFNLNRGRPYMLSTKFQFIPESGFREDYLEINQSETRMILVSGWLISKNLL
jgi:hypothetical protein